MFTPSEEESPLKVEENVTLACKLEKDDTSDEQSDDNDSSFTVNDIPASVIRITRPYVTRKKHPFDKTTNQWVCIVEGCGARYKKTSRRSYKQHVWSCVQNEFPVLQKVSYFRFQRLCRSDANMSAYFIACGLISRPQKDRRPSNELRVNERWTCQGCHKFYRTTSTSSIRKHLEDCEQFRMLAVREEIHSQFSNSTQDRVRKLYVMEVDVPNSCASGSSTPCFSGSDSSSIPTTPEHGYFPRCQAIPASHPVLLPPRSHVMSAVTLAENVGSTTNSASGVAHQHVPTIASQEDGEYGSIQKIGFLKSEPIPQFQTWPSLVSPSFQLLVTPQNGFMDAQDQNIFISPIFSTVVSQSSSLASTPRGLMSSMLTFGY